MKKEIISNNGYTIYSVDDPNDFYNDIERFQHGLFEAVNIEFENKNQVDIKLLFGHNIEYSEAKAYSEIDLNHTTFEIAFCSINDDLIYVFNIPYPDIYYNLKQNFIRYFKDFNQFIMWLFKLIYNKDISKNILTYFNQLYDKFNENIKNIYQHDNNDISHFIKHKYKFMYNYNLSEDNYNYLLNHENIVVNREYIPSLYKPVFIIDNDGKTLIKLEDYLKKENLTLEQYYNI